MMMKKTYNVITVKTVDIDIDDMTSFVVDIVRDQLNDIYDIPYESQTLLPDLIKEIVKNLPKTLDEIELA